MKAPFPRDVIEAETLFGARQILGALLRSEAEGELPHIKKRLMELAAAFECGLCLADLHELGEE